MPRRTQQVRQQRGCGALALGAGHAHGIGQVAVGIDVLAEPQRGATDELRALRHRLLRFGLVRADARRLDDHIERGQSFRRQLGFDLQIRITQRCDFHGFGSRTEQRQPRGKPLWRSRISQR
ncbi:hypothetical protein D3C71_1755900 [compost metagenome]